jgi:hypothetical protein
MSQQHTQFEEEFRDGPPSGSYQAGYTGPQPVSYTVNVPPLQTYTSMAGQKLVVPVETSGKGPSAGQRLALAIVSLVFVFMTFMITLGVVAAVRDNLFPIAPLAISFALIFAVVTLILNVLFSRRH